MLNSSVRLILKTADPPYQSVRLERLPEEDSNMPPNDEVSFQRERINSILLLFLPHEFGHDLKCAHSKIYKKYSIYGVTFPS